jgi:hypothetical protein
MHIRLEMDPKLRWKGRVYLVFLHSRYSIGVHVHFSCYNARQRQYEAREDDGGGFHVVGER